MKSLYEKRARKISKTIDFFVKSLHRKRANEKELEKFAMNTILEDLDHIRLEIGGSLLEMKSMICSFQGNLNRLTTRSVGDRFVNLMETFQDGNGNVMEEIEETNMSEIELQTFKDEWNHHVMDPRLWIYGENFYELISFDEEDRQRTSYNLESEEYEEFGESEESGESDESEESEESMESDEFSTAESENSDSDESEIELICWFLAVGPFNT